ncbi:MAG: hypothetical protein ACYYK0_01855 [Candidatus Eutrophobiaceae bacterium]
MSEDEHKPPAQDRAHKLRHDHDSLHGMLHEQARQKTIFQFAIIALIVGLFALSGIAYWFLASSKAEREERNATLSKQEKSSIVNDFPVDSDSHSDIEHRFNNAPPTKKEIHRPEQTRQPLASDLNASHLLHQQFIDEFELYKTQWQARMDSLNLQKWMPGKHAEITELKERIFQGFGAKEYAMALRGLQQLHRITETAVAQADAQFSQELQLAQTAYNHDNYITSKSHIETALMLRKDSPEALELQNRIELLRKIAPLLKQMDIAQIENKPDKELKLITQILAIDPRRKDLAVRSKSLSKELSEKAYSTLLKQASAALAKGEDQQTLNWVAQAEKIYSGRNDTAQLRNKAAALTKQRRIDSLSTQAIQAQQQDDWKTAAKLYENLLNTHPGDPKIRKNLSMAQAILGHKQALDAYLRDPWSMAGDRKLKLAASRVQAAKQYAQHSSALQKIITEVAALRQKMERVRAIAITSDNKTDIKVKGVGTVGKIMGKTIRLKPGKYVFEGKRIGYRSKLLDVVVSYEKDQTNVFLVCDEPI